MKSYAFVLASLAGSGLAAVLDVPADAQWFTIKTKASVNTLSNLYLSAKGGKIGAYAGQRESAANAGKFFTSDYAAASTKSFHAGDNTHQLGLQGKDGLLNLVDLTNPSADTIPKDLPTEWSVFQVGGGGELTVNDGSAVPSRTWVTYLETDGVYYVGLWDGVTNQPRTVANCTLIVEPAQAPKRRF
jgi:hypothetical protein